MTSNNKHLKCNKM